MITMGRSLALSGQVRMRWAPTALPEPKDALVLVLILDHAAPRSIASRIRLVGQRQVHLKSRLRHFAMPSITVTTFTGIGRLHGPLIQNTVPIFNSFFMDTSPNVT
jgi:hypothetical protein